MKSVILHGDEQVKSRRRLQEIILEAKSKGWDVTRLDGTGISRGDLLTSARNKAFFSENRLVVIENLFSGNSKTVDALDEAATYDGVALVVWERKKIDGRILRKFEKNFKCELFKIPQAIFSFLDSLVPGNARASLKLLAKVTSAEIEFLLYMIAQRARQLIHLKESPDSLTLAGWQKGKLSSQAKKWDTGELEGLHSQLLELDRQNKRSQLPENLASSLDLLVASL